MTQREISLDEQRLRKIKLMENRILIEWEDATDEYGDSGILRIETQKLRHYTGIVIGLGPDVWDVKVGDRVFFDQYASPKTFYFEGGRYAMIRESDALATVENRANVT